MAIENSVSSFDLRSSIVLSFSIAVKTMWKWRHRSSLESRPRVELTLVDRARILKMT